MRINKNKLPLMIVFIFISTYSCTNIKDKEKTTDLECLLDIFLEKKPTLNEKYIYISETQYWTDSSSVISFHYSKNPPSVNIDSSYYRSSEYEHFYLIHIKNTFNKPIKEKYFIHTDLNWEKINPDSYNDFSGTNSLNYSEYEIQFIYNFINEKVTSVLKAYPRNKKEIQSKLIKCTNKN